MPLGIFIILSFTVLLFFGFLDNLCFLLALNRKTAIILFMGTVFSYTLYPVNIKGITVYLFPFIIISLFSIYLLLKSKSIKTFVSSIISAVILLMVSQKIPPQPIGLLTEPFIFYGFILTILNLILKTYFILNSLLSVCFFSLFMVLTKTHVSLFCHDTFSVICASTVLSYIFAKGFKKCI